MENTADKDQKPSEKSLDDVVDAETKLNKKWVVCNKCGSKILRPSDGQFLKLEYKLPSMVTKGKNEAGDVTEDTLTQFWLVHDMFTFENIGFTNTLNNLKYLICADCEIGPIGFQDLSDKKKLYVAINRVGYST